jgi:hypothetical protein
VTKPFLIEFPAIGDSDIGFISFAENSQLIPFEVKRVFWTYATPETIVRGRHAHYTAMQVIIAVAGRIVVTTEQANGGIEVFDLDRPTKGVFLPPNVWHTLQYSQKAVQLAVTSTFFDENDYIRDYAVFKEVWKQK